MDAETLVREEHLIQELARKYSFSGAGADHNRRKPSASNGPGTSTPTATLESNMQSAFPKIKRVHDWLMHHQQNDDTLAVPVSTDCEASAENTGWLLWNALGLRRELDRF